MDEHIPGRFIEKADDRATLQNFLKASKTPVTADMNATRVEAEVYLARTLAAAAERIGSSLKDLADTTQNAMNNHAKALIDASQASGRYARSLTLATWTLVGVTVVLALLALIQLVRA